jgi:hypothetical protein
MIKSGDVTMLEGWGYVHKVVDKNVIVAGRDEPTPAKRKAFTTSPTAIFPAPTFLARTHKDHSNDPKGRL